MPLLEKLLPFVLVIICFPFPLLTLSVPDMLFTRKSIMYKICIWYFYHLHQISARTTLHSERKQWDEVMQRNTSVPYKDRSRVGEKIQIGDKKKKKTYQKVKEISCGQLWGRLKRKRRKEGACCYFSSTVWSVGGRNDWWRTTLTEGHIRSLAILDCHCRKGKDK